MSWLSVARELAVVVLGFCIDYFPLDWDGYVNTLTNMDTLVYSVYELDGLSRLAWIDLVTSFKKKWERTKMKKYAFLYNNKGINLNMDWI